MDVERKVPGKKTYFALQKNKNYHPNNATEHKTARLKKKKVKTVQTHKKKL